MIIAPLALYPRSRLDMLVLIRLCFGAITYMESAYVPQYEWVQQVQLIEGQWITSSVRLLTAAALIWLCITRRWGMQPAEASTAVSPPVLESLGLGLTATRPVENHVHTAVRNPVDNRPERGTN
jgi:hypothetical protein